MTGVSALLLGVFVVAIGPASGQGRVSVDAPRPIEAGESLWTEELTWMEVRDAIRAGKTTIIIGTGGVEQNGPYVAGGKHNFVLQTVLPYIARAIPNSLIAPIVRFVPEGSIETNQQTRGDRQEARGIPRGDHGKGVQELAAEAARVIGTHTDACGRTSALQNDRSFSLKTSASSGLLSLPTTRCAT